jgi:hypothetical protein
MDRGSGGLNGVRRFIPCGNVLMDSAATFFTREVSSSGWRSFASCEYRYLFRWQDVRVAGCPWFHSNSVPPVVPPSS